MALIGARRAAILSPKRTRTIVYERDFSTSWTFGGSSRTGGVADPDGGNNAITMTDTAASGQHRAFKASLMTVRGRSILAVKAKKGTKTLIQLVIFDGVNGLYGNFDLDTGALGAKQSLVSSRILDAGGGWWLCRITGPTAPTAAGNAQILLLNGDTAALAPGYLGDGTGTVQLYGAP